MKKSELKQVLKPLVKQCIKECLFEEGILSGVISEVLKGLETRRIVTEGITVQAKTGVRENKEKRRKLEENMESQRQERIKRLNESAQVGGVNIFEGIEEDTIAPETTGHGALDHVKPGDSGVNIDGIINIANGRWKNLL